MGGEKQSKPVPALIEVLKKDADNVWVAPFVAAALAEIGDRRCIEPLIAALQEPISSGAAVEALARLHDERAVEPLIRLFEKNPNSGFELEAGGGTRVAYLGHATRRRGVVGSSSSRGGA